MYHPYWAFRRPIDLDPDTPEWGALLILGIVVLGLLGMLWQAFKMLQEEAAYNKEKASKRHKHL